MPPSSSIFAVSRAWLELYKDVPVYSVPLNQVRHDGEPSLFEDPSISEHQMTSICNFRFRKLLLDAQKSGDWFSARPLQLISSDLSKNSIQGQLKGLGRRPGLKSSVQQKELGRYLLGVDPSLLENILNGNICLSPITKPVCKTETGSKPVCPDRSTNPNNN
ncbi:hypothetical protein BpHYR1_005624 [Brachionus plicatilis]|uniref:Uncharacterized protein n=1 Tax=Brachionus plicatilis TaxID=10195 RepID=A0A3M7T8C8_BRAPC|nr:hypothetical protein BpHYR1_005624 [Brachionus plicatilis]